MIFSAVFACLEGIWGHFSGQKAKLNFDEFIETVPVITFFEISSTFGKLYL